MKTAKLYLCDNGACYCHDHLGMTAKATGRDISGQPICPVQPSDVRDMEAQGFTLACEKCGAQASVLARSERSPVRSLSRRGASSSLVTCLAAIGLRSNPHSDRRPDAPARRPISPCAPTVPTVTDRRPTALRDSACRYRYSGSGTRLH